MQNLLLSNTNQTAIGVINRPGPTLDLNFAATKNCIDQVSGRDLITFTRSTTGTYFDSAGVLRSAAVNLAVRSEEFDNAVWTKTRSSITADSEIAPNGTLTADKIVEDTTASATHLVSLGSGIIAGNTYTYSVYAKPAGRDWIVLSPGGSWGFAWFNISSGTVGTVTSGGSSATAAIQSVGNGWYRCSVTATAVDNRGLQILMSTGNNVVTYTGDGTSGVFLWGAQLEAGSVATNYIPTTATVNSAPRFDHNPTTGESLGLLIEEQRTNSIRNNTMVGAVAGTPGTAPTNWSGNFTSSGITRQIVGTGIENGINYVDYRLAGTTTGALFFGVSPEISTSVAATNGQTWTFSSYARLVAGSLAGFTQINFYIAFNNSSGTGIQFVTGGITPTSAALNTQRFTRTATASNALVAFVQPSFQFEAPTSTAIDITLRIGLPQLEQGAFATSVIPTTTAAATRAADVASITGTNFSSWYRQSEGTLFYEGTVSQGLSAFPWFYNITDGTTNNSIGVYQYTSGIYGALTTAGTPITPDPSVIFTPVSGAAAKHALAVKTSDTRAAYNGTLSGAQTTTVMPVVNQLAIGQRVTGNRMTGTIRRIIYYPVRIPNALLQAITI